MDACPGHIEVSTKWIVEMKLDVYIDDSERKGSTQEP